MTQNKCGTCGYTWEEGKNGKHSCVHIVMQRTLQLEKQLSTLITEAIAAGWENSYIEEAIKVLNESTDMKPKPARVIINDVLYVPKYE